MNNTQLVKNENEEKEKLDTFKLSELSEELNKKKNTKVDIPKKSKTNKNVSFSKDNPDQIKPIKKTDSLKSFKNLENSENQKYTKINSNINMTHDKNKKESRNSSIKNNLINVFKEDNKEPKIIENVEKIQNLKNIEKFQNNQKNQSIPSINYSQRSFELVEAVNELTARLKNLDDSLKKATRSNCFQKNNKPKVSEIKDKSRSKSASKNSKLF
jgi:hypothetical protein